MKIDLELIRQILERVESECDGAQDVSLQGNASLDKEYARQAYHYKMLIDNGFLDGHEANAMGSGTLPVAVWVNNLTMSGHQLLDAMRNDTLWKKIQSGLKNIGINTLNQIPALALELAMKAVGK